MPIIAIILLIILFKLNKKNDEINYLESKVRKLEKEIVRLRTLLKEHNIPLLQYGFPLQ